MRLRCPRDENVTQPFGDALSRFPIWRYISVNISSDARRDPWTQRPPTLSSESGQAKAFLEFMSKGSTQLIYWQSSPGSIPTGKDADTSQYPALTKKAVEIVSNAKRITQYFDRDSRPDYSGPDGMQGFLLKFLSNPSGDTSSLQGQMQAFWDSLPPE